MAIYTRFGSEVKITGHIGHYEYARDVKPATRVRGHSVVCGDYRWYVVGELKADGGLREILQAAFASPEVEHP